MDHLWRQVGDMFGDLYRQTTEAIGQESLNSIYPSGNSQTHPSLSLSIPYENDIVPLLVDSGADEPQAIEMWNIHRDRALELGNRFQRLFYDTCRNIDTRGQSSSSTLPEKLASRLQAIYDKTLRKWTTDMINRIPLNVRNEKTRARYQYANGTRTPFNQEFRPYLEAFFDEKPFPSRAEKVLLARKSSMTFSQVNIWFQNRRARTKKNCSEKRQVKAVPNVADITERRHVDLEGATDTEREEISDDEKLTTQSRCSSVTLCDDDTPFYCPYRPYAFPTVYPPDEKDYPFPPDLNGFVFVKPTWTRCQSSFRSNKIYSDMDVDELSDALKRLSLRDENSDDSSAGYISKHKCPCNVMDPITTRPPSAPLPSLIRRLASSLEPYTRCLNRTSSVKTTVPRYSTERRDLIIAAGIRSPRSVGIYTPRAQHVNAISPSTTTVRMSRLIPPTTTVPSRLPMSHFACMRDTPRLISLQSAQMMGSDGCLGNRDFLHPEPLPIASPDPQTPTLTEFNSIMGFHDPMSHSLFDLFPPIQIPVNGVLD